MRSDKGLSSEKGFALVTAIIACVILFALAMLIINLSTGDLRVSARSVGQKKAQSAAESGISQLMINYRDTPPNFNVVTSGSVAVDAVNAPGDFYQISIPATDPPGPADLSMPGYSEPWRQIVRHFDVTGTNSTYGTQMEVSVAAGYGPVKIGGGYE
ncbi:MAG: pilus assembly PilX N-terminal domain-containing protein [Syntrophales bacterium LBB04]|nr:pilus assembly PilX N-terminal domain-containing protein [Syntrophales bacterium LBB04]